MEPCESVIHSQPILMAKDIDVNSNNDADDYL